MSMEELHKGVYYALHTPAIRALLTSGHASTVEAPALLLANGGTDRLLLANGGTDVLLIETFAPIYAYVSPQMFESEDDGLFPFITYSVPADTILRDKDATGVNAIVQVDAWHRTADMMDLLPLADAIFDALDRVELDPLTGWIETNCIGRDFDADPDGKTKRAMLQFRVTSRG